jgi:hypothetical protein
MSTETSISAFLSGVIGVSKDVDPVGVSALVQVTTFKTNTYAKWQRVGNSRNPQGQERNLTKPSFLFHTTVKKLYMYRRCRPADYSVFFVKRVLEEIANHRERDVPGLGLEHSNSFR